MVIFSIIVALLFVATSVVAGATLWVSEHQLRVYGLGVLLLLSPTFLALYLYRHHQWAWLLGTSVAGIILQGVLIKKMAEVDS